MIRTYVGVKLLSITLNLPIQYPFYLNSYELDVLCCADCCSSKSKEEKHGETCFSLRRRGC